MISSCLIQWSKLCPGGTCVVQLFNTHISYTVSQNKIHPEKPRIISSGPE